MKNELREMGGFKKVRYPTKCPICSALIAPELDLDKPDRTANCAYAFADEIERHWMKILYCDIQHGFEHGESTRRVHEGAIREIPRSIKKKFRRLVKDPPNYLLIGGSRVHER